MCRIHFLHLNHLLFSYICSIFVVNLIELLLYINMIFLKIYTKGSISVPLISFFFLSLLYLPDETFAVYFNILILRTRAAQNGSATNIIHQAISKMTKGASCKKH